MSYNRTLLYNGSSGVSSCTLSESVMNFERVMIDVINIAGDTVNRLFEFDSFCNASFTINGSRGYYSTENYINISNRIEINSDGTQLSVKGACILGTASNKAMYYTITDTGNNNNKIIARVYGINRIGNKGTGIGSPGTGWRLYNETVLWRGSDTSIIELSESASNFERLKIAIMSDKTETDSIHYIELDAPVEDGAILTANTAASTSNSSFCYGWSNWNWSNNCKTLTAQNGKSWTNSGTGSQVTISNNTDISDTVYNKRPILEIIGVNRGVSNA